MKGNRNKLGLIFGGFMGLWHLLWSVLVAFGVGQSFLDWALRLHFMDNPLRIGPFNLLTAVELISLTTLSGYGAGWLVGLVWELMHKTQEKQMHSMPGHAAPVH